jgi:hypothetical protein
MRVSLRLTALVVFGLLVAGQPANSSMAALRRQVGPSYKEIHDYVLTVEGVRKLTAAKRAIDALPREQRGPGAQRAENIDAVVQAIQKSPQVLAAVQSSGLTPREYFVGFFALAQAYQLSGAKKVGSANPGAAIMLDALRKRNTVSPANEAFVEQHWDEITKLMKDTPRKP